MCRAQLGSLALQSIKHKTSRLEDDTAGGGGGKYNQKVKLKGPFQKEKNKIHNGCQRKKNIENLSNFKP